MSGFDPRVTLALGDVAAAELEGVLAARVYRATSPWGGAVPIAMIRREASDDAEQLDQLLFGEAFDVLETRGGWMFGQARRDGYVGWIAAEQLGRWRAPTHWVSAMSTFAFARPSVRAPASGPFSLNALLTIEGEEGAFAHATGAGWVPRAHLRALGDQARDFVALAERHGGAPYLWGGRSSAGLDCSGLVLQALNACGLAAPRDSDQQMSLGEPASPDDPRRGDLIFWKGHVGIMTDAECLLHANAHHMAVASEPLAEARARIAASGGHQPIAARRLAPAGLAGAL